MIDLGIGHGKTGVLLREYMDICYNRYHPTDWKTQIYGVEIFEAYRNALWDYAYDKVVVADALHALSELPEVDLITALDVWEHFERSYAASLLSACLDRARFLLVSTPVDPGVQGAVLGNIHETHVTCWSPRDFRHVPHRLVTTNTRDWVLLLSAREPIPYPVWQPNRFSSHLYRAVRATWMIWRSR